jgi:hypothetical protein
MDDPSKQERKAADTKASQDRREQNAWKRSKIKSQQSYLESSCSFTAARCLELCRTTRNRRQQAPANGRHTIEFNVVGCPANANLRQNSSSKRKDKAHLKLKLAQSGSFIHIHHFQ